MDNFSRSQIIRKAVIPTRGGVVAAAHRRAAEVGASVLEAGGDAVDGAAAVAVPGVVSGMGLAHAEYGRLPWRDLLAPAVRIAKEGLLVDWFSTLLTTSVARSLAADPDAARMFLDDGTWPISGAWTAACDRHLDQSAMAVTLDRLARHGAREFYDGEVARALVRDLRAKGSSMTEADLAG